MERRQDRGVVDERKRAFLKLTGRAGLVVALSGTALSGVILARSLNDGSENEITDLLLYPSMDSAQKLAIIEKRGLAVDSYEGLGPENPQEELKRLVVEDFCAKLGINKQAASDLDRSIVFIDSSSDHPDSVINFTPGQAQINTSVSRSLARDARDNSYTDVAFIRSLLYLSCAIRRLPKEVAEIEHFHERIPGEILPVEIYARKGFSLLGRTPDGQKEYVLSGAEVPVAAIVAETVASDRGRFVPFPFPPESAYPHLIDLVKDINKGVEIPQGEFAVLAMAGRVDEILKRWDRSFSPAVKTLASIALVQAGAHSPDEARRQASVYLNRPELNLPKTASAKEPTFY
ncbi:MAG: hypothetical protein NUV69_02215 [Candidatus Curtissbacteria bacterium]|nr:hypothetical protein [Candidatus Curtissbacteria bacterium]